MGFIEFKKNASSKFISCEHNSLEGILFETSNKAVTSNQQNKITKQRDFNPPMKCHLLHFYSKNINIQSQINTSKQKCFTLIKD